MDSHRPLPPTVVLVEDDQAVRSALEFALGLADFSVSTFASGEDLLEHGVPDGPVCLVLDQRLPGITGLDTLKRLRADRAELAAVLVTSHPSSALRSAAAGAGVRILEKPLDATTLVDAIEEQARRT